MRFIPRIDIKSDYMIKSIRYDGLRNLGQPEVFAKKYYEDGATEIILIDTVSSLYRRRPSFETIKKVSNELRVKISKIGIIQNSNNKPILIDKKRGIISLKNKGYFHHF